MAKEKKKKKRQSLGRSISKAAAAFGGGLTGQNFLGSIEGAEEAERQADIQERELSLKQRALKADELKASAERIGALSTLNKELNKIVKDTVAKNPDATNEEITSKIIASTGLTKQELNFQLGGDIEDEGLGKLTQAIESKTVLEKERREKPGLFGKIGSFFGERKEDLTDARKRGLGFLEENIGLGDVDLKEAGEAGVPSLEGGTTQTSELGKTLADFNVALQETSLADILGLAGKKLKKAGKTIFDVAGKSISDFRGNIFNK